MTECCQQTFGFQAIGSRRVEADFTGGLLSTDGGALLLGRMDQRLSLCDKLAGCFSDRRNGDFVEHGLETLVRQRVLGLALGYEDLNDHDDLRRDPLLATACGHADPLGTMRRHEADKGNPLAGKSTLNRLELGSAQNVGKYRKINADSVKIEALLIEEGVKAIARKSKHSSGRKCLRRRASIGNRPIRSRMPIGFPRTTPIASAHGVPSPSRATLD